MKTNKKKLFWKYLLGGLVGTVLCGAIAGGIVSCSNGSSSTSTATNTNNVTSSTSNSNSEKSSSTTNNNSNDDKATSTPKTTTDYTLEKGASQPGLQYTSNAVSNDTNMVATSTPIDNQPGDLDIYAGNGLSAIITPSEIASGETINLTLNLASGVNAPTYKDLMSLPSLIAIQPYQSTSTYTIKQGKTLDMSLNANSSFDVNFAPLPNNWKNELVGSNNTTIETSAGQFGIYLLANNSSTDPIEFWTGLHNDFPNVLIENIPNRWMASADLTIEINGKSVPIDLSANLQSYFTMTKASATNHDFINLFYKDGTLTGANVNIDIYLTTWFWTDVNNANMLMNLGNKPGSYTVKPFTIITQTPGTANQFTILWNVTDVEIA